MNSRCNRFIEKSKVKHDNKYDYSLVEENYVHSDIKVPIICPIHGIFWQTPHSHLRGYGCQQCAVEQKAKNRRYTTEWFIEKSKECHGENTFDYSMTKYNGCNTTVKLICHKTDEYGNEHGVFSVIPNNHISKSNKCGCPKCNGGVKLTQDEFIKRINHIFDGKYDTSLANYTNYDTNVTLVCPKHGEFIKKASSLLMGYGCPKCRYSSLETKTDNYLRNANIEYIYEYTPLFLKSCKFGQQSLDFYLPKFNVAIECQGEQHFMSIDAFGGYETYQKTLSRDIVKYNKCIDNGIRILYLTDIKILSKIDISESSYIYHDNLYTSIGDVIEDILVK